MRAPRRSRASSSKTMTSSASATYPSSSNASERLQLDSHMIVRPDIELANLSDTGLVREQNEDYYAYAEPNDDDEFRKKGRLAGIADGMGGHQAGRIARGIAVDAVRR